MPELPEVEHARRTLEHGLLQRRIAHAAVMDARILDVGQSAAQVARALKERRVETVERRGKWLRIVLDQGRVFSHLGMTGKWVRADDSIDTLPHEKVRIDTMAARSRKTASLRYVDPRLFGRFVVVARTMPDLSAWVALGPDPLSDGIDVAALQAKLARRKLPIKPTLLDQTVLAGVGNIQATEALFAARIDPRRPARELSLAELISLAREIRRSIDKTMAFQEGPIIQYVKEAGAPNPFVIYGKEGTPCPCCRCPLTKIILAGRGTVFCAHCQT